MSFNQANVYINRNINECQQNLQPTSLMDNITINHVIELTMVDGKVATALSDVTSSSQCCSVCGATPT